MEKRIRQLEATVTELAAAVARLEVEVRALRARDPLAAPPAAAVGAVSSAQLPGPEAVLVAGASSFGQTLSLLGRTFLVLGGAFLIRALTDAGTLPRGAGVALGFGFALAWCLAADRALTAGKGLSAGFHAVASSLIAYPLVWETSTRLDVLSPPIAASALTGFALASVLVAERHAVQPLAWLAIGATVSTALALLVATDAQGVLLASLLVLLAASLWLDDHKGWAGPRWVVALAADFMLLRLGNGFGADRSADVSAPLALALALGLPALQLFALGMRALAHRKPSGLFEMVQVPLALWVGLHGASRITGADRWVGLLGLALAVAAYLGAFQVLARRAEQRRDLEFALGLGLGLTLWGGLLLGGGAPAALGWCALGVVAAFVGARTQRPSLGLQGALFLWAAAAESGLLLLALGALAAAPADLHGGPSLVALLTLAGAALGAAQAFRRREVPVPTRVIRAGYALLLALSVDGLLSFGAMALLADRGWIGVARTALLAATALGLAAARKATAIVELGWLAFVLLGAGALQILFDDLTHGRAATWVVAFGLYGLALILVSRLVRDKQEPPG